MNKSALKAAFNSLNFRCRFHGALLKAAKKGYSSYVTNRKGEPFLRVSYSHKTGFTFIDKRGFTIDKQQVYNLLRSI